MSSDYLNPSGKIDKHGDNLPHWSQDGTIQFVTFRLGDALPQDKIRHYTGQRRLWLANHPKPWSPDLESIYYRKFTWRLERWLDQGVLSSKKPARS